MKCPQEMGYLLNIYEIFKESHVTIIYMLCLKSTNGIYDSVIYH